MDTGEWERKRKSKGKRESTIAFSLKDSQLTYICSKGSGGCAAPERSICDA